MVWRLLTLSANLTPNLRENSNDLRIYRRAGEAILRGEVPYRDFFIEYPPGSLPFFVPPAFFGDSYIGAFTVEMALVLATALALTALAARRMRGGWAWPVPAATFAAAAVLLYPVATTRYDAVVALSLAVAAFIAAPGGRHLLVAYASLGIGSAAKLVPALATLPLALARRSAAAGYAVFSAVLALFFAPALLLGSGRFLESFAYHAQRGLQVESVGSSLLMALGQVSGVTFEFGAFEAQGPGTELAASLSLPVTAALLLLTSAVMYRDYRRGGFGPGAFPRYAAALILAFMLGSKVLSPQYVLWLLPLVPLSFGGLAGVGICALFLVACWTTTQIFPINYGQLLRLQEPGTTLLILRNGMLVLLWAAMLALPSTALKERRR